MSPVAGPSKEFLESISNLSEVQQRQLIELAWRKEHIEHELANEAKGDGAGQCGYTPPWHTRFGKGNNEGAKKKGRSMVRTTLRQLLKRKDSEGQSLAEHMMLEAITHAIKGDARYFSKIVDIDIGMQPGDAARVLNGEEIIIKVRPRPTQENVNVDPSTDDVTGDQ